MKMRKLIAQIVQILSYFHGGKILKILIQLGTRERDNADNRRVRVKTSTKKREFCAATKKGTKIVQTMNFE